MNGTDFVPLLAPRPFLCANSTARKPRAETRTLLVLRKRSLKRDPLHAFAAVLPIAHWLAKRFLLLSHLCLRRDVVSARV